MFRKNLPTKIFGKISLQKHCAVLLSTRLWFDFELQLQSLDYEPAELPVLRDLNHRAALRASGASFLIVVGANVGLTAFWHNYFRGSKKRIYDCFLVDDFVDAGRNAHSALRRDTLVDCETIRYIEGVRTGPVWYTCGPRRQLSYLTGPVRSGKLRAWPIVGWIWVHPPTIHLSLRVCRSSGK